MDAMEQRFAEEHEKFLKANQPQLHRSLSRSGKLQARLTSVGEQAAETLTHEMLKKVASERDLAPSELEKQLRGHHEAMTELVRHDLIHQPIPQPPEE
jgi:hypothetical protein